MIPDVASWNGYYNWKLISLFYFIIHEILYEAKKKEKKFVACSNLVQGMT